MAEKGLINLYDYSNKFIAFTLTFQLFIMFSAKYSKGELNRTDQLISELKYSRSQFPSRPDNLEAFGKEDHKKRIQQIQEQIQAKRRSIQKINQQIRQRSRSPIPSKQNPSTIRTPPKQPLPNNPATQKQQPVLPVPKQPAPAPKSYQVLYDGLKRDAQINESSLKFGQFSVEYNNIQFVQIDPKQGKQTLITERGMIHQVLFNSERLNQLFIDNFFMSWRSFNNKDQNPFQKQFEKPKESSIFFPKQLSQFMKNSMLIKKGIPFKKYSNYTFNNPQDRVLYLQNDDTKFYYCKPNQTDKSKTILLQNILGVKEDRSYQYFKKEDAKKNMTPEQFKQLTDRSLQIITKSKILAMQFGSRQQKERLKSFVEAVRKPTKNLQKTSTFF